MRAVGEGDRARLGEQTDLGDLASLEALGQRRGRKDADLGVVARAAQDEVDDRRIVDRRIGVGAHDEARHAAGGGGGAGAGDRLAMLGARLADEGAHVDEARRDDVAARSRRAARLGGSWSRVTAGPTPAMTPSRTRSPPRVSASRSGSTRRALRRAMGGADMRGA